MEPRAPVRRVAPVESIDQAGARLFQALYGCAMHPAGLLHAIAATLDAEAEGRFTLADVADHTAGQCRAARALSQPAEAWRYDIMARLCERLAAHG